MKACIILMIMIGFLCSTGFAQKKETVEELSNRVKNLEDQKENLAKQGEFLQKQFEVKAKELQLMAEEIKLEQKRNNWIIPSILLFLFTFIGWSGFVSLKKYIEKKTQEKAEKLVNEVYKEKAREILELARKQNEEFQLKETKSILVVSKNSNDNTFLEKFFNKMEFRNVQFEILNQVKNPEKYDYDLLLFNNENLNIDHADLRDIMAKTKPGNFCLYFGSDKFEANEFKDKVRFNFANSQVQLYGNLINSLRYQSLLK